MSRSRRLVRKTRAPDVRDLQHYPVLPQTQNCILDSQARRKSESAAILIRERNVKRNTTISLTARNPFAPPVPPKDKPSEITFTTPVIGGGERTLCALEKEWMLNDYIHPTPTSNGGISQTYLPNDLVAVKESVFQDENLPPRQIHPCLKATPITPQDFEAPQAIYQGRTVDTASAVASSDPISQNANHGVKYKAAKRDTVADLLSDIMGSDQEARLSRQETLDEVATLSAVPLPLRIPNKLNTSLRGSRGSSIPPMSKFNKLELSGRPSLQIVTTFANPRTAPEPIAQHRGGGSKRRMSHPHGREDKPARTSMVRWSLFPKVAKVTPPPNDAPPIPRKSSLRRTNIARFPQDSAPLPAFKQRRANTFPAHKSPQKSRKDRDIRLTPTMPQRRNTQPIIVNRMRDPAEAFDEYFAVRKSATNDVNEATPAAPNKANSKRANDGGGCFGLYTTAKPRVSDVFDHMRNVGPKNRARKKRKEVIDELRRKQEEMARASIHASAKKGDGGYRKL
jgi:hypothetical protein